MNYILHSHRHGLLLAEHNPHFSTTWNNLLQTIDSITDSEIIDAHNAFQNKPKSLSKAINNLLKEKLMANHWNEESAIFQSTTGYTDNRWRLDFAKDLMSVEVAFNHGEAIAWNLVKPVIASELNHVAKDIQSEIAVVVCATENLKVKGGFDGAVGEYEKFLRYLVPLQSMLTVPMIIIGLEAPTTFEIRHRRVGKNQIGDIEMYT